MAAGQPLYMVSTLGGGTVELEQSGIGQLSMVFGSNPSTTTAVYATIADDTDMFVAILVQPGGTFSYAPANTGRPVGGNLLFMGSSAHPEHYDPSTIDLVWNLEGRQSA